MDTSTLRTFHEVVKAGSIRKASDQLGVAASSVSRQISVLERVMGTTLLERTQSGVILTHAGMMVASYARSVILDFDALRSDLNDIQGRKRKLIRLAVVESVLSSGPVAAMADFRSRYDSVAFRIEVMPAPKVVDAVKNDSCDIGITFCPKPDADVVSIMQINEPVGLVVLQDHPLASVASVPLAELGAMSLALPERTFSARQILDEICIDAGVTLEPVLTSNAFESLRNFALCQGGGAILPWRAGEGSDARLKNVAIASERLNSTWLAVMVLRSRRLPRVVSLFMETLEATLSKSSKRPEAA